MKKSLQFTIRKKFFFFIACYHKTKFRKKIEKFAWPSNLLYPFTVVIFEASACAVGSILGGGTNQALEKNQAYLPLFLRFYLNGIFYFYPAFNLSVVRFIQDKLQFQ
ncbi:MAG: hypothetical protein EOP00_00600 [Pedobacter sp.]|nr:MAG: hypothetical protein EOP00_00600 [Pedobacter sp.]